MADYSKLSTAILDGDAKTAETAAREALEGGADPMELVTGHMIPAMDEVGRRFECEEYFVPELLLSGRAMKAALALIRPLLAERGAQPVGRVVIGTVKGDLHDIGKNLVSSMLEGAGFEITDLGADVAPDLFVAAAREKRANIVCLSALLTVTMPSMKTTIEAFETAGTRRDVKIMIGGAPVTQAYADHIGADAYGENAAAAVTIARTLVGAVHV
ncbi:MAG TPA: corrinoid protein [Bryobacteraceae bacterium]|nr:corrinoid protein [Bryobacteraceae bacterium]